MNPVAYGDGDHLGMAAAVGASASLFAPLCQDGRASASRVTHHLAGRTFTLALEARSGLVDLICKVRATTVNGVDVTRSIARRAGQHFRMEQCEDSLGRIDAFLVLALIREGRFTHCGPATRKPMLRLPISEII